MTDRQMADLMARQLLALRASTIAFRDRVTADAEAQLAQLDCGLELVRAMQERADQRTAAAGMRTPADEPEAAPPAPPATFGRARRAAPDGGQMPANPTPAPERDSSPAPSLPAIPPGLAVRLDRGPSSDPPASLLLSDKET